ncbi:hypothetical protein E2542_SST29358 [Spatholobus suberectus]|nr:hypothetical protein E2542_SST29358 [Spatholobus suberectus]
MKPFPIAITMTNINNCRHPLPQKTSTRKPPPPTPHFFKTQIKKLKLCDRKLVSPKINPAQKCYHCENHETSKTHHLPSHPKHSKPIGHSNCCSKVAISEKGLANMVVE